MQYMGSKRAIKKEILPIILANGKRGQWYIEPFAGGMNVMENVPQKFKRHANDIHYYLIEMWKALCDGWIPPKTVSESTFQLVRKDRVQVMDCLKGYIGFGSYGGRYFQGYPRASGRDYWLEYYNNIMKQVPKLQGVKFTNGSFERLQIPDGSIVYCDPPYEGTKSYTQGLNHEKFWDWVRLLRKKNQVFVSEYHAPDDFECIWQKRRTSTISENETTVTVEKLFI